MSVLFGPKIDGIMARLDALPGSSIAKTSIAEYVAAAIDAGKNGRKLPNMLLDAPAGVDVTAHATLIADALKAAGVITGGLTTTDYPDRVGTYIGQTEVATGRIMKAAEGGVLLMKNFSTEPRNYDSAALHTVNHGLDQGQKMAVIVAGTKEQLARLDDGALAANTGFGKPVRIGLQDLSGLELTGIYDAALLDAGLTGSDRARRAFIDFMDEWRRDGHALYANTETARDVARRVTKQAAPGGDVSEIDVRTVAAAIRQPSVDRVMTQILDTLKADHLSLGTINRQRVRSFVESWQQRAPGDFAYESDKPGAYMAEALRWQDKRHGPGLVRRTLDGLRGDADTPRQIQADIVTDAFKQIETSILRNRPKEPAADKPKL